MTRPAAMTLLLFTLILPSIVRGQAPEDDKANQVSNDNPSRPFQMPPASAEVKEALDDFERFGRRGAWERALKSLYTIPEAQASRFLDGGAGFIIPVSRKRHSVLAKLPPEGQAAYRVFYDSEAKKLIDEADGPTLLSSLERAYSAYFNTSIGDNAADRLGDLYHELGRFDRAADCWLAILRERPDTDLAPGLISLKAAMALHRAGRRSEFDQVRSELAERYDDEKVTIGGVTARPTALLKRWIDQETPASKQGNPSTGPVEAGLELAESVESAWQVRFAESIEAGMTPPETTQWESNALSAVVPAVADGGSSIFVNFLGYVFALDAKTGKMLWRSASFHQLDVLAMQNQAQMIDPARFAVIASDDLVWTLERDLKDQNMFAPFRLACRRAEGGEVVWRSEDLADYAQFDLYGVPLLADGKLFVVAKSLPNPQQQELPKQFVLAIQPRDGKVLWKTEAGTFRQGPNMYYYYYSRETTPQPTLLLDSGALYLDTHAGAMARLDADSGTLDWGFGYKTEGSQGESRFFYYYMPSGPTTASGPTERFGDALLVKGAKSDQLVAVDPDRMKVLWDRPISTSSRLLGTVGDVAILGGPELSALDLKTRELLWANRLPGGSLEARVLVRPDGIWQLTPRGVFEVDPASGQVRRIFRGDDLGSIGGDLLLTNSWLISASNRTITAYPRRASGADRAAPEDSGASRKRASNE